MGQVAQPNVIEAERIILRDTVGSIRAELSVAKEGGVALRFLDEKGKTRAILGLASDSASPSLKLSDNEGVGRAWLTVDPDGSSRLTLRDRKERPRAGLIAEADGSPRLALRDTDGQYRIVLGSSPLEPLPTRGIGERSPSSLILFDKDGNVIWKAP
jgi:hypothetical protein